MTTGLLAGPSFKTGSALNRGRWGWLGVPDQLFFRELGSKAGDSPCFADFQNSYGLDTKTNCGSKPLRSFCCRFQRLDLVFANDTVGRESE